MPPRPRNIDDLLTPAENSPAAETERQVQRQAGNWAKLQEMAFEVSFLDSGDFEGAVNSYRNQLTTDRSDKYDVQKYSDGEIERMVESYRKQIAEGREYLAQRRRRDIQNVVEQGGFPMAYDDVIATNDQQKALQNKELFQLNPQQRLRHLAYTFKDDPDKLVKVLTGKYESEPDIVEATNKLKKPVAQLPSAPESVWWKAAETPNMLGNTINATTEGVKQRLLRGQMEPGSTDLETPDFAFPDIAPPPEPAISIPTGITPEGKQSLGDKWEKASLPLAKEPSIMQRLVPVAAGAMTTLFAGPAAGAITALGGLGIQETVQGLPAMGADVIDTLPEKVEWGPADLPIAKAALNLDALTGGRLFPKTPGQPKPSVMWSGMEVSKIANQLTDNPDIIWDAAAEAWDSKRENETRHSQVRYNGILATKRYRDQANELAKGDPKRAQELFERYVKNDDQLVWNPALNQMLGEIVLDPVTWLGAGALTKSARSTLMLADKMTAGKASVWLAEIRNGWRTGIFSGVADAFSYMPHSKDLDSYAYGADATLGELTRTLPHAKWPQLAAEEAFAPLEGQLAKLEALGITDAEWPMLESFYKRGATPDELLPGKYQDAIAILREMPEQHQPLREAYNVGQSYVKNEGPLQVPLRKENYAPERARLVPGEATREARDKRLARTPTEHQAGIAKRNAKAAEAENLDPLPPGPRGPGFLNAPQSSIESAKNKLVEYDPNLVRQWRLEIDSLKRHYEKGWVVNAYASGLAASGAIKHVRVPGAVHISGEELADFQLKIEQQVAEMSKRTGQTYGVIDLQADVRTRIREFNKQTAETIQGENMGNAFRRLTGQGGDELKGIESEFSKGSHLTIMPESAIRALEPYLTTGIPKEELAAGTARLAAEVVLAYPKAADRVWRGSVTIGAGAPFMMMNAGGAVVVSAVNAGATGALDARRAAAAVTATLASGGLFDEGLRAQKFVTHSGQETTIGTVIDKLIEAGAPINQDALRMGQGPTYGGLRLSQLGTPENLPEHALRLARGVPAAVNTGMDFVEKWAYGFGGPGAAGSVKEKVGAWKLSLQNANRMIDNGPRFHFAFGAIKDVNNVKHMAHVADQIAKFTGDYRRLGTVEKRWVKEFFGFYNWARYISGWGLRMGLEHPGRIGAAERMKDALGNDRADLIPASREAYSEWLRGPGIPAGASAQPDQSGAPVGIMSHEAAVVLTQTPYSMSTDFARQILGMDSRAPIEQVSLSWRLFVDQLSLRNLHDGSSLPSAFEPSSDAQDYLDWDVLRDGQGEPQQFLPRAVTNITKRPSEPWLSMWNLYGETEQWEAQAVHGLRYRAGRSTASIDHAAAYIGNQTDYFLQQMRLLPPGESKFGFKPRSLGGLFQTGLEPGSVYLQDLYKNTSSGGYQAREMNR